MTFLQIYSLLFIKIKIDLVMNVDCKDLFWKIIGPTAGTNQFYKVKLNLKHYLNIVDIVGHCS